MVIEEGEEIMLVLRGIFKREVGFFENKMYRVILWKVKKRVRVRVFFN